ncbi:hypothetical protein CMT56_13840 [Elizabethkingia anophelis]|uniref:Uncharacterized protein n=1 Tax=Elizabethkingia anophelis TaxID=1117645 RepID=A0A455ZF02_9FLAO|nr:hypothetical protein [Elizabethkingia anophelis]AQW94917.1 hypothetical protein BBD30_12410 [Elizabethkingia anophelis]MCL1689642.1 hypothetical protein [Elizabethkingia anophelis]MDV3856191.1 hypothetical protein [Elizabethkingia anophelis]MDV3860893.1 hypothetical protein [Elizabethkingia anophelis]MDV3909341.1 hypothetical protein [Elizabethkingia anophelis]
MSGKLITTLQRSLNQTVLGESRVFIKENELAEIRKLIVDSGSEITEEELSGIITILDTIFRLAIKEFIIH